MKLFTWLVLAFVTILLLVTAAAPAAQAAGTPVPRKPGICSTPSSWTYCKAFPFTPTAWDLAGWR